MAVRTQTAANSLDGDSVLHILVSGPDVHATIRLPASGRLVIGRDDDAQIRILDPRASRQHALLHVGSMVEVEDLGSTNGTRLGSDRLPGNQRVPLAVGQALLIGSTTLLLQYQWVAARTRTHGHFYDRLVEECARCEGEASFGLLRIHIPRSANATSAVDAMIEVARPGDLLATYASGEYELLLPDSGLGKCEEIAARIADVLDKLATGTRVGLAFFPRDGVSPGALLARACSEVRGGEGDVEGVVVNHPLTRALYEKAALVAKSNASVLVLGETGVGKEVLARTLHKQSQRTDKPFLAINCASFNETTLEDQLFGHERGAFSGADRARPGLLEAAHGGTLFLDEVGDMSLPMQAKLLRALDRGEIIRIGSSDVRKVDVRFVAATNKDLNDEVKNRRFREDLYHRLAVVELRLPPLCERKEEIEPLARQFLQALAKASGRRPPELSPAALAMLQGYDWPGNVRELKNLLEQALALCPADTITPEHLPAEKLATEASARSPEDESNATPADPPEAERQKILAALAKCAGNQTRAAKLLGTNRFALMRKLKELEISRPRVNRTTGMLQ
jgi:two-component system, NtrC family, response regulator AtoC